MKAVLPILAMLPVAAAGAVLFEPPQVAAPSCPDTEASTNLVFDAGAVRDNRWSLVFEVDGTAANNAQIEFGTDSDGNGELGLSEREFAVGWDCGEWFVRDVRGGDVRRMEASAGRSRLEWTLHLKPDKTGRALEGNVFSGGDVATWFNPAWNMSRVAVRGIDAANELVRSQISISPLTVRIR